MPRAKFGTDGIRGRVGTSLTPDLALGLGYWTGQLISNEGPLLIGQDTRKSGSMLSAALTAGVTASGREVWGVGVCPTPAIPFLIDKYNLAGGFMVSASHNPPEDNGIKIFLKNGEKLDSEVQLEIEKRLKNDYLTQNIRATISNCGEFVSKKELIKDYIQKLKLSVLNKNLKDISIVLDLCHGSATCCAKEIFDSLGAKTTILHGSPNGNMINVKCGSTDIAPLRKAVLEIKAEMGFAFDGDSDRMIAIDSKGRVIDGDHVLYLWGSYLLQKNLLPGKRLVCTVMSNLGFEYAWNQKGGVMERTPVGDKNVYAKMIETGAKLGGEQSGHILCEEHGLYGDGILSAIQLATICNSQGKSLDEWRDESFEEFPKQLVNIPIQRRTNEKSPKYTKALEDIINSAEDSIGKNGRVLVRQSGTEPVIRVLVEGENKSSVDRCATSLTTEIEKHLSNAA